VSIKILIDISREVIITMGTAKIQWYVQ
jgi:hypothetical protein